MVKQILTYALIMSVGCIGMNAGLIEGLTTAAVDTVTIPERVVEGRPLRGRRPYYREGSYAPSDATYGDQRMRGPQVRRESAMGQVGRGYYANQPKSMMGTELEQQYKITNPISSTAAQDRIDSTTMGGIRK